MCRPAHRASALGEEVNFDGDVCRRCLNEYGTYHTVDVHELMLHYMHKDNQYEACEECRDIRKEYPAMGEHRRAALHTVHNTEESVKMEVSKKRTGPPTPHMVERVQELKDHELFDEYEWLMGAITTSKMMDTMGGCGKLISMMKAKINAKGGNV